MSTLGSFVPLGSQMILHALFDGYRTGHFGSGHTRYQCQCGFKYIVADCGQAVGTGRQALRLNCSRLQMQDWNLEYQLYISTLVDIGRFRSLICDRMFMRCLSKSSHFILDPFVRSVKDTRA